MAKVTAITRRKDAYYLDISTGRADHLLLDAPMLEAYLYNHGIESVVPGVRAVHMPISARRGCMPTSSWRPGAKADPKTAITIALSSDYRVKHVIVVDEDVDVL